MSKRLVAGTAIALMVALAGCQAPAGTSQPQMLMKQIPKATKLASKPTELVSLGSMKTVIKGNFDKKARSVLFVAADVETIVITATNTVDPARTHTQTLVKADAQFGGNEAISTINGMFPGDYNVTISAFDGTGANIGGGGTGPTPVSITSGVTAQLALDLQLAATAAGALTTTINIIDGD